MTGPSYSGRGILGGYMTTGIGSQNMFIGGADPYTTHDIPQKSVDSIDEDLILLIL